MGFLSFLAITIFLTTNFISNVISTETNSLNSQNSSTLQLSIDEQQFLTNLSNYCLSKSDFEELYGNKSKFALVTVFAAPLLNAAYIQIGQDELRQHFCLKPQHMNFTDLIHEEKLDNCNSSVILTQQLMEYFEEKIHSINTVPNLNDSFWSEDIVIAAKFLDKKFPEIRQLFKLKYLELAQIYEKSFEKAEDEELVENEELIDKFFDLFSKTRRRIFGLSTEMLVQSVNGVFMFETSKCYKKRDKFE